MLLENLLKAKGFDDVVVSVGTSSNSVNVIVASDGLTRENTAVIYKTVATETGYEADYIRFFLSEFYAQFHCNFFRFVLHYINCGVQA